jgi:hypothetical protein
MVKAEIAETGAEIPWLLPQDQPAMHACRGMAVWRQGPPLACMCILHPAHVHLGMSSHFKPPVHRRPTAEQLHAASSGGLPGMKAEISEIDAEIQRLLPQMKRAMRACRGMAGLAAAPFAWLSYHARREVRRQKNRLPSPSSAPHHPQLYHQFCMPGAYKSDVPLTAIGLVQE